MDSKPSAPRSSAIKSELLAARMALSAAGYHVLPAAPAGSEFWHVDEGEPLTATEVVAFAQRLKLVTPASPANDI